jgi:2-methylcitrate dehydratase PrpD
MTGLTEAIGRFVADPGFASVPDDVLPVIKSGFIDASGTLVCGRQEMPVPIVQRYAGQSGQTGVAEASLFFGTDRASAEAAALINATACHVLDYDDVGLRAHPSTVLVPAILAEAERRGAPGATALRAYLVGYEVWAELNAREPDAIHVKGWHPTSAVGVVAAAAAVAHLIGLDADKARNAIALAASMSGGVVANFGSMMKSFQVARASAAGVLAARLAEAGMDGSGDALERQSGLLNAMSPKDAADRSPPGERFGRELAIRTAGLSFKKYPVCYCAHRVIDAVIDMATANRLEPSEVKSVTTRIGETQMSILRNHGPGTALEAKFSIEFAVAAALVSQSVGLRELDDAYVTRPDVQALMGKVAVEGDGSVCPVEPAFSVNDRVWIAMNDGRTLDSGDIRFSRGHARLPLGQGELKRKFLDCCRGADLDPERLYGLLAGLERVADMRSLAVH